MTVQKLRKKIAKIPKKVWVAIGIGAIMLIALSECIPSKKTITSQTETTEQYLLRTEKRMTELIGGMDGVGNCRVMITLENGVEYVYASEQETQTNRSEDKNGDSEKTTIKDDTAKSVVIVNGNGERQGLLITEMQPTVRGVVVICDGGDDPAVAERVKQTVMTALDISSSRVCVTK